MSGTNSQYKTSDQRSIIDIYTEWANHYLYKVPCKKGILKITNLEEDLKDGTILAHLIVTILEEKPLNIVPVPRTEDHKLFNLQLCLDYLVKNYGVNITETAEDVLHGQLKAILSLFFQLSRLKHKRKHLSKESSEKKPTLNPPPMRSQTLMAFDLQNMKSGSKPKEPSRRAYGNRTCKNNIKFSSALPIKNSEGPMLVSPLSKEFHGENISKKKGIPVFNANKSIKKTDDVSNIAIVPPLPHAIKSSKSLQSTPRSKNTEHLSRKLHMIDSTNKPQENFTFSTDRRGYLSDSGSNKFSKKEYCGYHSETGKNEQSNFTHKKNTKKDTSKTLDKSMNDYLVRQKMTAQEHIRRANIQNINYSQSVPSTPSYKRKEPVTPFLDIESDCNSEELFTSPINRRSIHDNHSLKSKSLLDGAYSKSLPKGTSSLNYVQKDLLQLFPPSINQTESFSDSNSDQRSYAIFQPANAYVQAASYANYKLDDKYGSKGRHREITNSSESLNSVSSSIKHARANSLSKHFYSDNPPNNLESTEKPSGPIFLSHFKSQQISPIHEQRNCDSILKQLLMEQEKVRNLNTELTKQSQIIAAFEQSLANITDRLTEITACSQSKDVEIQSLKMIISKLQEQKESLDSGNISEREDIKDKHSYKFRKSSFCKSFTTKRSKSSSAKDNLVHRMVMAGPNTKESSLPESDSTKTITRLKEQLVKKENELTETRLEALSSAHQLESLNEVVTAMQLEIRTIKCEKEKILSPPSLGDESASSLSKTPSPEKK